MDKPYILVQGLGLNQGGLNIAKHFAKKGRNVIVTDIKTAEQLKPSIDALKEYKGISFVLGKHREEDFINAELVVANPDVSPSNQYVLAAKNAGVPVHTEMTYFFANKKCKTVGITGTRGKSTTTNLAFQILKLAGKDVYLGGNLGVSMMEIIDTPQPDKLAVLELSSFMLEWMREYKQSPEVGLVLNIMIDHLSRHKTMADYVDVKGTVFKYQDSNGVAILNYDDDQLRQVSKQAKGKLITFSMGDNKSDFYIDNDFIVQKGTPLFSLSSVIDDETHPLFGDHNKTNILASTAIARLFEIDTEIIENAIINYEGLYGRQMPIGEINGVKIINDTCATTPDAVLAALNRFRGKNIILLTGGTDKELDYSGLASYLKKNDIKAVVVLSGSGSEKLLKQMKKLNVSLNIYAGLSKLETAVDKAFSLAAPGDYLVFSPGGSSFEMFKNEFDRGKQFDDIVNSIKISKNTK